MGFPRRALRTFTLLRTQIGILTIRGWERAGAWAVRFGTKLGARKLSKER